MSKSIYPRIFGASKAKEAWDILKNEFQGNDKVISIKLQSLWRDFDNMVMKESESIQEFLSKVAEIVNQIRSYGDTLEDKKIVQKVLRSLPPKFDHVAAAIEESKDLQSYTLHELMCSLQAHEQRINRSPSQPLEQAFQSKVNFSDRNAFKSQKWKKGDSFRNKGKGQYNQNKGDGKAKEMRQNSQQRSINFSNSRCRICKKPNHETKDCRYKCKRCKNPNHSQTDFWFQEKKENDEANFVEDKEEHLFSCMSVHHESQHVWYLDSGCSNHMTGNRDIFVELDQSFTSQVKLGDGKLQGAKGKGVTTVNTKQGNEKLISDVLYVPNMTQNLLSLGQLIQKGYSINFEDKKCRIFYKKNNLQVEIVKMCKNKVFPFIMPLDERVHSKSQSLD